MSFKSEILIRKLKRCIRFTGICMVSNCSWSFKKVDKEVRYHESSHPQFNPQFPLFWCDQRVLIVISYFQPRRLVQRGYIWLSWHQDRWYENL